MANLKDISTIPELEALEGTEKVLLNVDGSARQARVDLIKPKDEWDIVIDAVGTYDVEEDEIIPTYTMHYIETFEKMKEKLLSGKPIKGKCFLRSQIWSTEETRYITEAYEGTFMCVHFPENFDGSGTPEYIDIRIRGNCLEVYFALTSDNTIGYFDLLNGW